MLSGADGSLQFQGANPLPGPLSMPSLRRGGEQRWMGNTIPHSKLPVVILNEEREHQVVAGIGSLCRWAQELHLLNTCDTLQIPRHTFATQLGSGRGLGRNSYLEPVMRLCL